MSITIYTTEEKELLYLDELPDIRIHRLFSKNNYTEEIESLKKQASKTILEFKEIKSLEQLYTFRLNKFYIHDDNTFPFGLCGKYLASHSPQFICPLDNRLINFYEFQYQHNILDSMMIQNRFRTTEKEVQEVDSINEMTYQERMHYLFGQEDNKPSKCKLNCYNHCLVFSKKENITKEVNNMAAGLKYAVKNELIPEILNRIINFRIKI